MQVSDVFALLNVFSSTWQNPIRVVFAFDSTRLYRRFPVELCRIYRVSARIPYFEHGKYFASNARQIRLGESLNAIRLFRLRRMADGQNGRHCRQSRKLKCINHRRNSDSNNIDAAGQTPSERFAFSVCRWEWWWHQRTYMTVNHT